MDENKYIEPELMREDGGAVLPDPAGDGSAAPFDEAASGNRDTCETPSPDAAFEADTAAEAPSGAKSAGTTAFEAERTGEAPSPEDTAGETASETVAADEAEFAGEAVNGAEVSDETEAAASDGAEDGGDAAEKSNKKPRRPGQTLFEWAQALAVSISIIVVLFTFFARIIGVDGDSMNPTLTNGDRVIISGLFYTPKHGDIVVLHAESFSDPLIKRVIAVEGETVRVEPDEGKVYVNGVALDEDYTAEPTLKSYDMTPSVDVIVPDGCVFVMGDNRNHSSDSRSSIVGMVDERQIIGKAYWRLLPVEHFGGL